MPVNTTVFLPPGGDVAQRQRGFWVLTKPPFNSPQRGGKILILKINAGKYNSFSPPWGRCRAATEGVLSFRVKYFRFYTPYFLQIKKYFIKM